MMDYTAAAIILFMIMIAGNMLWLAGKITNIEKMLHAILEGGKFIMPKVNDGMHMLQLAVKAGGMIAKRVADKARARRMKNMGGVAVVPDVDDAVYKSFVRMLWNEVKESDDIESIKLTESVWVDGGKFPGSRAQFVACMERLRAARITTVEGKKNVRKWMLHNNSYDRARRHLEMLAK